MQIIKGFTLIELVIVLTLISLLLILVVPGYQALIANSRTTSGVNQLIAAINYARSEAVKRRSIVTLCSSQNGQQCGGLWRNGWLVFVDKTANGQITTSNNILRTYNALPPGDELTWSGSLAKQYLQMAPSGGTYGQAGTFVYSSHKHQGIVKVSQTGRVRIEK